MILESVSKIPKVMIANLHLKLKIFRLKENFIISEFPKLIFAINPVDEKHDAICPLND